MNQIDPECSGVLRLKTPPITLIDETVKDGSSIATRPLETLNELLVFIEHLELSHCILRTNHTSNYLPLRGTLSRDKDCT